MPSWEEVESFCHHQSHEELLGLELMASTLLTLKLGQEFCDDDAFAGASAGLDVVAIASMAVNSGRPQIHQASQFPRQHLCLRNYQRCLA